MKPNLIFLSLVFLVIILFTGFIIKYSIEYFTSSDPIITTINDIQKKFIELGAAAKKSKKTLVSTPDGQTPVITLISLEYQHLSTLKNTYKS